MEFWRKYGWIIHSMIFIVVALLSVYGLVAVIWHEFNLRQWRKSTQVFAFILSSVFILPIISAMVGQLINQFNPKNKKKW